MKKYLYTQNISFALSRISDPIKIPNLKLWEIMIQIKVKKYHKKDFPLEVHYISDTEPLIILEFSFSNKIYLHDIIAGHPNEFYDTIINQVFLIYKDGTTPYPELEVSPHQLNKDGRHHYLLG